MARRLLLREHLAVAAAFALAGGRARDSQREALAVALHAARLLARTAFAMLEVHVALLVEHNLLRQHLVRRPRLLLLALILYQFGLEGVRITLEDVELGELDLISALLLVAATVAAALRATVNALSEALTVQLEAAGLGATAFGAGTRQHLARYERRHECSGRNDDAAGLASV